MSAGLPAPRYNDLSIIVGHALAWERQLLEHDALGKRF